MSKQRRTAGHKAGCMRYPPMRRDLPPHARSVAKPAPRFHVKKSPRLPLPSCTQNVASRKSHSNAWDAWEVRDILLAVVPITCTGPTLPVAGNMVDRPDGREDNGRAA